MNGFVSVSRGAASSARLFVEIRRRAIRERFLRRPAISTAPARVLAG